MAYESNEYTSITHNRCLNLCRGRGVVILALIKINKKSQSNLGKVHITRMLYGKKYIFCGRSTKQLYSVEFSVMYLAHWAFHPNEWNHQTAAISALSTHLCHQRIVNWYLPGGASEHSHLTHNALNPYKLANQTATQLVQWKAIILQDVVMDVCTAYHSSLNFPMD